MITIPSSFIGNFKLGDNIVHNLAILKELYALQGAGSERQRTLLRKPIVVTIASVAEAVLYDLYLRISNFTREGVSNIPDDILEEIRNKTIDQFAKYIANARSKGLLGADPELYVRLDELRRLRNRIHIQNSKGDFEPDEEDAFCEARQADAEQTLEALMRIMEREYARDLGKNYVEDFVLPWDERCVA